MLIKCVAKTDIYNKNYIKLKDNNFTKQFKCKLQTFMYCTFQRLKQNCIGNENKVQLESVQKRAGKHNHITLTTKHQ